MKPTGKQISDLSGRIRRAQKRRKLTEAGLAKMANVDASQVNRVCAGQFKTISANVVQICNVLGVRVPRLSEERRADPEWTRLTASLRRVWDETPQDAVAIGRVLDAIAELRASRTATSRLDGES